MGPWPSGCGPILFSTLYSPAGVRLLDGRRMLSRTRTYCPHCGRIVPAGQRCPCRPRPKRKPTAGDKTRAEREPWRRSYSIAEYQAARQQAIARTSGRCTCCGRACAWFDGRRWRTAGMGGEVDHVVPLCKGGTNCASNLQLLCKSCHGLKDAKLRRDIHRRSQ